MKRILHYGLSNNLGGIETYIRMLYSGIDKDRYVFDFLIDEGTVPHFVEEYKKLGSKIYYMTPRNKNPYHNIMDVKRVIQNENIDAFHFHINTLSYLTPVLQSINKGLPTIIQSHSSSAGASKITRLLHYLNKKRVLTDDISKIAVSDKAGKWLFGNANYTVINNGIDPGKYKFSEEKRTRFRKSIGATEADYLVVHVGAFLQEKNHRFLIKVFSEFHKNIPKSKLILVGTGHLEREMKHYAKELRIIDKVLFLGVRSDVATIFSGTDLFLLPSKFEGFPIVSIEAQTSGIDMIMSDTITSEVIVNDNNDVLPINNTEELWVDSMLNFYEKSSDIELREKAYRNVEDANLTNKDTVRAIENLYKEILEK